MGLARGLLTATLLFAVAGVILIIIALATDNWKCFTVDDNLRTHVNNNPDRNDEIFYTRTYGFFRECFPGDGPTDIFNRGVGDFNDPNNQRLGLYKSPHGTRCVNAYPGFKHEDGMELRTREYVNMKIAYITLYSIGLFIAVLALLFMCIGIGLKKGIPVVFTGFSFLLAAIFLAAAIGVWHKSNDELKSISNFRNVEEGRPELYRNRYNPKNWGDISNDVTVQDGTVERFCWSYFLAWIGIVLIFLTAFISCCLTVIIAKERKVSRDRKLHEMYGVSMNVASGGAMQMPSMQVGGGQNQIYATGGSEKAMMPYMGADGGAYSNYGYAGQQYGGQYPQGQYPQYNYYDYMGYYNPFSTMGR